jgi:superfamily II DNA or RNA helicase
MQKVRSHLAGEQVEARGESWMVLRSEAFDACTLVTLRGTGDDNLGRTSELIAPFDRITPAPQSSRIRRVSRRTAVRAAAAAITRAHGWSEPWTAATARLDLLPWQLEPAIAAVNGATRLLLADGVGLGKTVQAAFILSELRARGFVRRALVLTPASLREQWAAELRDRFALEALVFDHAALTRLAADLPPTVNPWTAAAIAISSIDLVKRGEVRRALDAIPLDLLIVDEAHHLRPGTDRGALVADLAARIPWLVLATATPHSGEDDAYAFLRNLGCLRATTEMTTFRRGPAAANRSVRRHVGFHGIPVTKAERELLDQTVAYGRAVWRAHKALVAAVICRRAVSSPSALLQTLRRRRRLLAGDASSAVQQSQLPWQENDERDGIESDEVLASARLPNEAAEREWLDRLIQLTCALGDSSKARSLERLLARTTEPAIVFSEYRDTLAFLHQRLSSHTTVAVIHGGLSARERRYNIQQFVSGGARVLLATDAAGEGLNLQQRCRLIVNVELPWNPLRLEQRIGRVDRIGQSRPVHAIQLFHRDTFEDEVLARFEKRIQNARRGLCELPVGEHAMAAAVFEGVEVVPLEIESAGGSVRASASDAALLRRRASLIAAGSSIRPTRHTVCAPPSPRSPLTARVVALYECDFHDAGGRLVAREGVPLLVEFDPRLQLRRGTVRRVAAAVHSCDAVRAQLDASVARRRSLLGQETEAAATGIEHRLEQILDALDVPRRDLVQASLFDRRAEQRSRANEAAVSAIREHLKRRLVAARALRHVRAARPRLIALWPCGSR